MKKRVRKSFGRRSNSSLVVQCPATLYILMIPSSSMGTHTSGTTQRKGRTSDAWLTRFHLESRFDNVSGGYEGGSGNSGDGSSEKERQG